jgi:hypothetical protein
VDRALVSRALPHDFRKTVVTLMDEAGLSVQSAANQLGYLKPRCLHIWTGRNGARPGRPRCSKIFSRPELLTQLTSQEPHPE